MVIDRRMFLGLVMATALASGSVVFMPALGFASDDGHEGGDDGGHDKGGDDGHDAGGREKSDRADQDEALDALKQGKIISLQKALAIANGRYVGRVIDVKLTTSFGRPYYAIKFRLDQSGQIKSVRIDARTGKLTGFLGL